MIQKYPVIVPKHPKLIPKAIKKSIQIIFKKKYLKIHKKISQNLPKIV